MTIVCVDSRSESPISPYELLNDWSKSDLGQTAITISLTDSSSATSDPNIFETNSLKHCLSTNISSELQRKKAVHVYLLSFADDIVTASEHITRQTSTHQSVVKSTQQNWTGVPNLAQEQDDIPKELTWVTYNKNLNVSVGETLDQSFVTKSPIQTQTPTEHHLDDSTAPENSNRPVSSIVSQSVKSSNSSSSSSETSESVSTLLESDDSSESSLITYESPDPAKDSPDSKLSLRSLKMRKHFDQREKDMRRITCGNMGYRCFLSRQEELVQVNSKNIQMLQFVATKISSQDGDKFQASKNATRISIIQKFQQSFLFERYHTFPGIAALIAYVVAHCSCYEFFYQIHLLTLLSFQNRPLVHGLTFLAGVALTRMSGSIWNWLNSDRYEGAKFSMHNKLRLGHLDARLLRWIRKRKHFRLLMDIAGVYLCFISVAYALNELLLPTICDSKMRVLEDLPSRLNGVDSWLSEALGGSKKHSEDLFANNSPFEKHDQCMADSKYHYHEVKAAYEAADAEYLYQNISLISYFSLFGWENAPIVTSQCQIIFTLFNSIFAMAYLFSVGVGFWDD